jgi:sugar phosphate isomerase/epimerase
LSRPIYVSTAALGTANDLWETLSAYRQAGLSAVELGACRPVQEQGGVLARRLEEEKLELILHNYFPPPAEPFVINLASTDRSIRERSIEHASVALELSARLGAPFYSVHAGFVTDPTGVGTTSFVLPPPASAREVELAKERFVDALQPLLWQAGKLAVVLIVENNVCSPELRGRVLAADTRGTLAVLDASPSPFLGLLVDLGHLNVSATTLGFDRIEFIDALAQHVREFHLHDNDGATDTHSPAAPGSWTLDVLRRPEFANTPLTVESHFANVDDLHVHVDFLKSELT